MQQTVYEALYREKRTGESFSMLLRRLLEQRQGLSELSGSWGRTREADDCRVLRAIRYRGRHAG